MRCWYVKLIPDRSVMLYSWTDGTLHLKLDPNADVVMLDALKKEIEDGWPNIGTRETSLKVLLNSFSTSIQISAEQTCLTNDRENEMRYLVLRYPSPRAG
jgi:hypothetical protein